MFVYWPLRVIVLCSVVPHPRLGRPYFWLVVFMSLVVSINPVFPASCIWALTPFLTVPEWGIIMISFAEGQCWLASTVDPFMALTEPKKEVYCKITIIIKVEHSYNLNSYHQITKRYAEQLNISQCGTGNGDDSCLFTLVLICSLWNNHWILPR